MVPLVVTHQKVRSPWKRTRSDGPVDCTQTCPVLPLQSILQWIDLSAENAVLGSIPFGIFFVLNICSIYTC